MTTLSSIESQRERDKKIEKARKALRACQQERDSFMLKHPDHAAARTVYEARVKELNAALDRLLRGGA